MFKPLLANPVNLPTLRYPVLGSPKYDGFRCVINTMGEAMSRNLKPVRNAYTRAKLEELELPPFDGELLTYTNGKVDNFDTVQSKLTTVGGRPDFRYMIFDSWEHPGRSYLERNADIGLWFVENTHKTKNLEHVLQHHLLNETQVQEYEAQQLEAGWEGIMLRDGNSPYKFGRSTTKEGILLKLKRFFDAEAEIIGLYELMHNANEATESALGYKERSSHKANMVGMGTLGGFNVRFGDVDFDVGTGFDAAQRSLYWSRGDDLIGQTIKFKYQSLGTSGKPRFPVFLGIRNEL